MPPMPIAIDVLLRSPSDSTKIQNLTLSSLKGGDSYGSRRETSCFIADCPPGELR